MDVIIVDIICPKCKEKAIFHSTYVGTYKMYPDKDGKVSCTHCGFNSSYHLTNKDYFYQIPIGKRILYAMNKEKLISLKIYFENNCKMNEPDLDFPKEFYLRKNEIIQKINLIIQNTIDQ
jgi:hypothetical protein